MLYSCSCLSKLINPYFFNFQKSIGRNVEIIKDKKSNCWDTKIGNRSAGNIAPTNKLLEKSGAGNKRNPPINPTIIEIYAVFSSNFLL